MAAAVLPGKVWKETFVINKKAHEVVIEQNAIKWRRVDKGKATSEYRSVDLENVLGVTNSATAAGGADRIENVTDASASGGAKPKSKSQNKSAPHFTVHYVNKNPSSHLWKHEKLTLYAHTQPDNSQAQAQWVTFIEDYIRRPEAELRRPKHLLVFVNPNSGGSQGVQIYEKKVAPLFKLAGIQTDVTITQNAGHPGEVLSQCDMEGVDGVVSVGGDGTFLLCFNGLLQRVAKEAGIDLNDAAAEPAGTSIPVGIIPAGTGQGMVEGMTGTKDPVTAALHIIMGEQYRITLFRAFSGGKLLCFGSMLTGYGYFGDSIRKAEKMRYLGRGRYPVALVQALADKRIFDAEVHFRPQTGDSPVCNVDESYPCESSTLEPGWKMVKGSFIGIQMFLMDLTQMSIEKKMKDEAFVPRKYHPGVANIYLTKASCTRFQMMKWFGAMMTGNEETLEADHTIRLVVEEYKLVINNITEFTDKNNCFNVDGEPHSLTDNTVYIKRHADLLPVFGAGIVKILGIDKRLESANQAPNN